MMTAPRARSWAGSLEGKRRGARWCSPSRRTLATRDRKMRMQRLSEREQAALLMLAADRATAERRPPTAMLDALLLAGDADKRQPETFDGSRNASPRVALPLQCEHCAGELAPNMRRDARFCSARCRSARWRRNRQTGSVQPLIWPAGRDKQSIRLVASRSFSSSTTHRSIMEV